MSHFPTLPRESTLAALPTEYPTDAQDQISQILNTASINRLVVLDDDPTGTQTCHDINVLTVWDIATLTAEFRTDSRGFFILTNSRALPPTEAELLIRTICENVSSAANSTGNKVDIVLRGDSTLRGHFPLEPDVAQSVFGPADALILAPFFFQGGRLTIDDVHYVAEGDNLVPAGATQFAKDATFGYKSSNLRDYVLEKAPRRFSADKLCSVTINDIRKGGPDAVREKLLAAPAGGVVIVNAAAESDMHVFVAGLLLGEYFSQISFNKYKNTLNLTKIIKPSPRASISSTAPAQPSSRLDSVSGRKPPSPRLNSVFRHPERRAGSLWLDPMCPRQPRS